MRELSDSEVFGNPKELTDDDVFRTAPKRLNAPGMAIDGQMIPGRDMRQFDFKAILNRKPEPAPLRGSPGAVWSAAPPAGHWTDNVRDPAASVLKIGPTALKGVADIARLLTGDSVGGGVSGAMRTGMDSIDDVVGSDRLRAQKAAISAALENPEVSLSDFPGMVAQNPVAAMDAGISTVGSMFLPAGIAAGAIRAAPSVARIAPAISRAAPGTIATNAAIGTGAFQNAAETFADTQGHPLLDRYQGAGISAAASLVLGKLFGGGAEGEIARRIAGQGGYSGAPALLKTVAKAGGKEFGQEFGEEGANYIGKQVAKGEDIDPLTGGKHALYGGMLGLGVGGASGAGTSIGSQAQPQNRGASPQVAPGIDQPAPLATPPIEPEAPQTAAPEAPDADPVRSLAKLIADTAIQPSPLAPKQAAAPQAELTDHDVFGDTAPSGADLLRDATKMVPEAAERMAAPEMQQEIGEQLATEPAAETAAEVTVAEPTYLRRNIKARDIADEFAAMDGGTVVENDAGLFDIIQTDSAQSNAAEQAQQEAEPELRLPKELAGAKPRYSYGGKQFDLTFESDIDRAAYIAAQATPSERDADYVDFAVKATGQPAAEIRKHGAKVRAAIKAMAKDATPGTLTVPTQYVPKVVDVKSRATVKKASNTLLQAIINRGGISRDIMQDVGGDPRGRYAPGLFTKTGITDLSELAESLVNEDGFAIDLNSDVGGARELEELIARMLKGERITNTATMEAERNQAEAGQYRDEIRAKAKELGVRTVGRKFADVEAEVLAAEEARHQARIDDINGQERMAYDALLEEARSLGIDVSDVVESIPDNYTFKQAVEATAAKLVPMIEQRLAELNSELQQATEEREPDEQSYRAAEEADAREQEQGAGAGGEQAGPGRNAAQGSSTQAAEFDLAGQSNEEVAAAEKAAKEAEAKRLADERAAEQRRQADAERDSFTLTGSDRAADVAAANGQNDLFSTAQDAAAGMPVADVEAGVKEMLGEAVGQALLDAGIISIDPALPADVQGATYRDGRIVLNPKALDADTLAGVVKHEGFHSTIKELVGQATYDKLMARLQSMLDSGVQWAQDARAAVPSDTKPEHVLEEVGAYAIEQYANGEKQPTGVRAWVESLLSAIRTALIRYAKGRMQAAAIERMQPQDLARLAVAGLKAKAAGMQSARLATAYSEIGPFGPVLTGYRGDPQGAIAKLMELKDGEAVGALSHPDIGEIDLVWGEEGTGASDGFGLAKLAKWHPEVLGDLQGVLSEMKVTTRSNNRVNLESESHRAGVRLDWDRQRKTWLMTAFAKRGGAADTRTDTAGNDEQGDTARLLDASGSIVDQKLSVFYSRATQTETPAFKKWFGDSKVVESGLEELLSKPDGVGVLLRDLLAAQNATGSGLNPVQALMLALAKNDKIGRGIVGLVPVDVVNSFSKDGLRPKDGGGNTSMFVNALNAPVSDQVLSTFRGILTSLSTKLANAIATGRDQEIAPALLASDFNLREVGGLLSLQGSTDFWGGNTGVKSVSAGEAAKSTSPGLGSPAKDFKLDATALADLFNKFVSFAPHAKTSISDDLPSAKYIAKQGKPLVVYHGTTADFSVFKTGKGGVFFSDDSNAAGGYGAPMPAYLSLQNPVVIDAKGAFWNELDAVNSASLDELRKHGKVNVLDHIKEAAEKAGYDGAIILNVVDNDGAGNQYVAFRPEQIKSAIGNNGDFDPANPDIRYSKRTPKNDRSRPTGDEDPQSELALPKAPTPRPEMPTLSDAFRFDRTPSGRRENVAGRKIYDRLASYATDYLGSERLGWLALADDRPEAFKTMMRRWRVDQQKAAGTAKKIAEEGQKLTIAQRKAISALIEKQMAVGDMPPQEIVDLAANITASLEIQARELVELGMLSEDRLVENYLPRLYQNPTVAALENGDMLRTTLRKAMMRMRGERLRQRGMTAEFKANQVEAAKKLGWKIDRDGLVPEQLEAIEQGRTDMKIPMWRDYTKKEREAMGEIDDAILRYAVGYMETQKDVAIGRLFQSIAGNADLAKTFNPGGWKRVPERKIEGTNGLKAYGKLAGMWVHPSVAYSLEQYTQPKGTVMAAHDKLLSMWKEGKVVWNPVSHGNNIASNVHTAVFAGLNIASPQLWRDTLREYKGKGEYFNEAVEAGLFGNDIVSSEIIDMLTPDLSSMKSVEAVITSRLGKLAKMAQTAGKPVGWYRKTMQTAYEAEDQIFKLMAFMESRKAGATPEQAVAYAERYFFNYNDMPAGIELVKKFWVPFVSYTYRATPMLVHTVLTRPDLMLLPAALYMGANMLGYALSGGDEEEERKAMPEYMQGWSAATLTPKAIRLPFNMNDRPAFYDISRRVPMGDLFDVNNQLGGAPIPQPFMPGHPLLSLTVALLYNKDTFTGKELTKNSDTFGEAFKARVGYTYRQLMPNAVFVPGSYSFNQALDGIASATDTDINLLMAEYTGSTKSGDPVDPLTAALSITGVAKVRSFDPQKQMDYKSSDFNREAREIRANIRSIRRDQSLTDERKEKRIAEQREKQDQLRARRDKELN